MRRPALAGAVLPLLVLAGCGGEAADDARLPEGAEAVECALAGTESFAADCAVERIGGSDARELVIWHPDGGFRRFELLDSGRWLVAADGADEAVLTEGEGFTELRVAGDRYRLTPAILGREATPDAADDGGE